ncbi:MULTISPECIES: hypothetical protein [unclassified Marinobacter]|uniref:hypothetical protein n=1 Tax=unclassified Marinobacter TaxID=83889 RepID=UPI001906C1AA|nr:hypothetical protein [Marinobacter sp. 1-4A]MBK1851128.1 hypothetical protein [Marinobacter sp. 1-4A]
MNAVRACFPRLYLAMDGKTKPPMDGFTACLGKQALIAFWHRARSLEGGELRI